MSERGEATGGLRDEQKREEKWKEADREQGQEIWIPIYPDSRVSLNKLKGPARVRRGPQGQCFESSRGFYFWTRSSAFKVRALTLKLFSIL